MDDLSNQEAAVELLQQLGLKEYEAKSFVAASQLPQATAKEVSELSDVPRTRVYDAIRVLETKGLVEIQHSSPREYRAVPVEEAVQTLREEYQTRTERLHDALQGLESASPEEETESTHEVWALTGGTAIKNRTDQLVAEAETELILVVGERSILTDELFDRLRSAQQRDVTLLIGTTTEEIQGHIQEELPDAEVFLSGLEWLHGSALTDDETEITRLLLLDKNTILVSTVNTEKNGDGGHEQAVFGRGFDNGIVAITRRLMATGLSAGADPEA